MTVRSSIPSIAANLPNASRAESAIDAGRAAGPTARVKIALGGLAAATRQTETGQAGAEKRKAGRLRGRYRRDVDARRRLE